MRSDREIMALIMEKAKADPRVLAVYLKGSRTNPNVPEDVFRDFDVMYVAEETENFVKDASWLESFGTVILKQEQKDDFGFGDQFGLRECFGELYSWLLLFEDGSRIDIGVETVSHMMKGSCRNKLFLPLLDKTGCLPKLPPPSDEDFQVKKPSKNQYLGCCNEFYWSLCDVEKGIARDELPFAMTVYYTRSHHMLEQMLEWQIGCGTEFSVSCGKYHKYLKKYLSEKTYGCYEKTFSAGDYESLRKAIGSACRLFRETACLVAEALDYRYPQENEDGYLRYRQIVKDELKKQGKHPFI